MRREPQQDQESADVGGSAQATDEGGKHVARRGRLQPRPREGWPCHSMRFLIPNELLDDPVGYYRTVYTDYPDTFPEE